MFGLAARFLVLCVMSMLRRSHSRKKSRDTEATRVDWTRRMVKRQLDAGASGTMNRY
jgi:hypothetical protein